MKRKSRSYEMIIVATRTKYWVLLMDPGEGVHNFGMDVGLPPDLYYQNPLLITETCPFVMKFSGNLPIFNYFLRISRKCAKKGHFFRKFSVQKPTHMGGNYPYP